MFEISWSELLILAVVTLIFVGPKDLPKFLNTLGRYAGMVRRHASEFRAQFDEAMREAELDALKKEVEGVRGELADSVRNVDAPMASPPVRPMLPVGRTVEEMSQEATGRSEGKTEAVAASSSSDAGGKGA